jgi:hypothetical protein
LPAVSTAATTNLCGPVVRLFNAVGLAQLENGLLSRLHRKPAIGLFPGLAVNVKVIEFDNVVQPFCT